MLVSHNEKDLTRFCRRGLYLDAGRLTRRRHDRRGARRLPRRGSAVTLAIVLAAGAPAAGLPPRPAEPLADRLAAQLRRAGADEVRFAADLTSWPRWWTPPTGPVLVSGADLVAHTAVLRHLATSPVGPTVALVLTDPPAAGPGRGPRGARPGGRRRRCGRRRRRAGVFGGALRVGVVDLPALAAARPPRPGAPPSPADGPAAAGRSRRWLTGRAGRLGRPGPPWTGSSPVSPRSAR